MKSSIATLSLIAGLMVSAGSLYQSDATQRDTCIALEKQALAAAQAPIMPKATGELGFTPMAQFNKVYPPSCQPASTEADVFSSLIAGALVAFGCMLCGLAAVRLKLINHKDQL